ncbi:MAG: zinc-binding dehydrogenase [Candidatus Binataceae bacterium]|nr:zinc-binding dehydrogenase [Candidatus Binataceae bacterium]
MPAESADCNCSANQSGGGREIARGRGVGLDREAARACVIGTVSSDAKAAIARQYGADEVINYTTQDFAAETMRLTEGRGANLILDAVGKPTLMGLSPVMLGFAVAAPLLSGSMLRIPFSAWLDTIGLP